MVASVSAPVSGPVTSRGEPLALTLHRLAAKGHAEGLIVLDDLGAAPFACRVTSSRPGHAPYVVNLIPGPGHGCVCEGFATFQYCKHYALCVDAAGWLPDVPLDGDDLDDHGMWEAAVARSPSAGSPSPRSLPDWRTRAAADLAARYPQEAA